MHFFVLYIAVCTAYIAGAVARVVSIESATSNAAASLNRRVDEYQHDLTWPLLHLSDEDQGFVGIALAVTLPTTRPRGSTREIGEFTLKLDTLSPASWALSTELPENQRLPGRTYWARRRPVGERGCGIGKYLQGSLGAMFTKKIDPVPMTLLREGQKRIDWPVEAVTSIEPSVEGALEVMQSPANGDGTIGLSPSASLRFVSAHVNKRLATAHQLEVSLSSNRFVLGDRQDEAGFEFGYEFFGRDPTDAKDRWTIRSDPPSPPLRQIPLPSSPRIQVTTGHVNILLANSVANSYFSQWPREAVHRDARTGKWHVDCQAIFSAVDFTVEVQGTKFKVIGSAVIGPRQPQYQGGESSRLWCLSLVQELPEGYDLKEGIWASIGQVQARTSC